MERVETRAGGDGRGVTFAAVVPLCVAVVSSAVSGVGVAMWGVEEATRGPHCLSPRTAMNMTQDLGQDMAPRPSLGLGAKHDPSLG